MDEIRAGRPGRPAAYVQLVERLRSGRGLQALDVGLAVGCDERVHLVADVRAEEFRSAYVERSDRRLIAIGELAVVAGVAVLAAGAERRRAATAADATPRWRSVGPGRILVTDRRVVVGDPTGGRSIWLSDVRLVTPDLRYERVRIDLDGQPPVRFAGPGAACVAVALVHLVHGKVLELRGVGAYGPPPPPPPQRRRRRLSSLVG